MPGTIHVSVLDFKDFPSSSPPTQILIKVSLGKREYQTWDKGDFSFPLTTLRDNVTITIQDTEGNEISNAGLQTISVVEKGSWDEFLPLEGGGHVHIKLQFVLSEEERNRIRRMRESAMKKKRGEMFDNSRIYPITTGGTFTSSSGVNNEVSDSQKSVGQKEKVSIGNQLPERAASNEKGTTIHQRQINPNDTDKTEETSSATSMSKRVDVDQGDISHSKSVEKLETKLLLDVPKRLVFSQEDSSTLKNDHSNQSEKQDPMEKTNSKLKNDQTNQPEKQDPFEKTPIKLKNDKPNQPEKRDPLEKTTSKLKNDQTNQPEKQDHLEKTPSQLKNDQANQQEKRDPLEKTDSKLKNDQANQPEQQDPLEKTPSQLKNDQANQPEKRDPLKKTPSNVRKMISAFESSLTKDMRPGIKPPPAAKSQSIKVGPEVPEVLNTKEMIKPAKQIAGRLTNPFLIEDLAIQKFEVKREEKIGLLKDLSGRQVKESTTIQIKVKEAESDTKLELRKPWEDLVKFPSSKVGKEALKDPSPKEIKPAKQTSGKLKNPFLTAELQTIPRDEVKREERIGFDSDLDERKSSLEPSTTQIQVQETESDLKHDLEKPQEDLVRMPVVEEATVLGQSHDLLVNRQDSGSTEVTEQSRIGIGIDSSYSHETNARGLSEDKLKSEAICDNDRFSSESSGAWMFPDHARRLCTTTGSNQVMEVVEGCGSQERTHYRRKTFSLPENEEKPSLQPENYTEAKRGDNAFQELKKSRLESSAEVEASNGPLGQAIKIAIMVAFGALVLLTRQTKPR